MKLKKLNPLLAEQIEELQIEITPLIKESFSTIKSGSDIVIVCENTDEREDLLVLSIIQRLEKPDMLSPRALIIAPDKETVLRLVEKFENYGKKNDLRIFFTHEKTNLDEDKNLISLGIDVLIGTPERLNLMFSVAGFDVNQLKMFSFISINQMLKARMDGRLQRLSESIGKTQRLFFAEDYYEKTDFFVERIAIEPYWFDDHDVEEEEE